MVYVETSDYVEVEAENEEEAAWIAKDVMDNKLEHDWDTMVMHQHED